MLSSHVFTNCKMKLLSNKNALTLEILRFLRAGVIENAGERGDALSFN